VKQCRLPAAMVVVGDYARNRFDLYVQEAFLQGRQVRTINSLRAVGAILAVAVLAAVGVSFLPDDPYQRFQLLHDTDFQKISWIYERIHYDPKPVDVAIIGPSRTLLGVSADEVEKRLATLGKPASVANLSIVAAGRNLEWVMVDELYKTKKPRTIVIAIDEKPDPWGHPMFKYIAAAESVMLPPSLLLHNYIYDISYLPFRQIELFAASIFPRVFEIDREFDPVRYAKTRSDFTTSFSGGDGQWIDMDRVVSAAELSAEHLRALEGRHNSIVPKAVSGVVEADDRLYVDKIARLAAAHGTKLLFVYAPAFKGELDPESRRYYERYGTVVDNGDLARQSELFSHWSHFNHAGAMILSNRIAEAVAPDL
jgi:hypothetical protein